MFINVRKKYKLPYKDMLLPHKDIEVPYIA